MTNRIDARKGWRLVAPTTALLLGALFLAGVAFAHPLPSGVAAAPASALVPVATPPGCVPGWRIVESPNPTSTFNALYKVDAVSSTDVWGVGWAGLGSLIEHWDGSAWSIIPAPVEPYTAGTLLDVAARSTDDVWAVGFYDPPSPDPDNDVVTILHWNGTAWSDIPGPDVLQSYGSRLSGVDAVSANDVWAVGWTGTNDFNYRALTLHWDGAAWSVVPNPLTTNSALNAVTAIASDDVWAVGGAQGSLLLHWDGSAWNVAPTSASLTIYDVSAVASNDVWAVGNSGNGGGDTSVILHWNGTAWSQSLSQTGERFHSVTAISVSDVWVVGEDTRALHWDGTQWLTTYLPRPYPYGGDLFGVAAISPGEVLAVGRRSTELPGEQTVAVRYTAACPIITPTPTGCETGWVALESPNGDASANSLRGVTVVSSNDIWAVGTAGPGEYVPLSVHWDGYAWAIVPMPNPQGGGALYAVSAVASNDVWAVGWASSSQRKPLTMHWDGTQWSIVPGPSSAGGTLIGVAAISTNDVWAVGGGYTMHWDGSHWSVVPNPSGANLYGVSALSSGDVWAVGRSQTAPVTIHWDGNAWSLVPNLASTNATLTGVTAIAPNDVWAVGETAGVPLTLHWDGVSWTNVPIPDGILRGTIYTVSASGPDDVWAVGERWLSASHTIMTLALHWNGAQWETVSSADVDQIYNTLHTIAVVSRNQAWAVGDQGELSTTGQFTLIERYISSCVTVTPTAIPTYTPTNPPAATSTVIPTLTPASTATHTPIPIPSGTSSPASTATATSQAFPTGTNTVGTAIVTPTSTVAVAASPTSPTSPTTCPMSFTDVPSGSAFYTFIRCLTCRGIISGYSDGTFRPNNNVTRGQLSKIVSNAAGFNEAISGQTFQDVSPGSDFYLYVERMSRRAIIGGYPCGGAGEPCGAGNKPYFRLNSGATRGQIAKIVSNARGYSDTPGGQTFQDVPTSSPFYLFVERLAARGIMGGYPCGGVGEQCSAGNKPYFRPNANATRGQVSKIVTNTFFPGCQGANP